MRKILFSSLVFFIFTATVFSASFQPNVLKLTVSPSITYKFDGSNLAIPVTVTGTPVDISFLVFTKDQGSKISKIMNGYLGWHYVNKIDTCVYMSAMNQFVQGANTINWNGKGKDGALVPAGTYTYYMFGYDNKSEKVCMTKQITPAPWNYKTILEKDSKGIPLAKPLLYQGLGGGGTTLALRTINKWTVGNDPEDSTLKETCRANVYRCYGGIAFLPSDQTKFFYDTQKMAQKYTRKFTWVPNGDAVLNVDWGVDGEYIYSGGWSAGVSGPGVVSDGKDYLLMVNSDYYAGKFSTFFIIDINEGSDVKKLDISKWWVNLLEGDPSVGGQVSGGPTELSFRNGVVALGSHTTCTNSLMDPYADTTDAAVLWVNRNGDLIGDHNWETTTKKPWVCNDYNVGPYKYTTSMDNQGFVIFPSFDMGAVSFGLYAPDGTGVAYKAYAGETAQQKYGCNFIDYSSPYDGIYTTQTRADSKVTFPTGTWFVAHDSIKGVISNWVGVEESAPTAFSVAQNTPNPFNPITSISFTLAKEGKVTVDIYNAAGQKVDTLVNTSMKAGSHSVTWNASRISAGVYFYTVKSGDFSKTMKMTLLK
ncbi:MAG: FlgD immunoglobulin-like domain containing protein [Candidatus Latescibacter sp.]|nr:FlgD immunoglobulin-like domain containing protein [Candidatus Latescibacter sp.]